jgi:hypothetical protein
MERRGELAKGTLKRWLEHTPNIKTLPERIGTQQQRQKARRERYANT